MFHPDLYSILFHHCSIAIPPLSLSHRCSTPALLPFLQAQESAAAVAAEYDLANSWLQLAVLPSFPDKQNVYVSVHEWLRSPQVVVANQVRCTCLVKDSVLKGLVLPLAPTCACLPMPPSAPTCAACLCLCPPRHPPVPACLCLCPP